MTDWRGPWVVDASVALKWVVFEAGSGEARSFLERAATDRSVLLAPELWWAELANALWKKALPADGLLESEATSALHVLRHCPVAVVPQAPLAETALQFALALGITANDAMYLALAEARDAMLVTFDTRLARKLRTGGWDHRVHVPGR